MHSDVMPMTSYPNPCGHHFLIPVVRACCFARLEGLDGFHNLRLGWRIDVDIKYLYCWWYVGRGWWWRPVECFSEVFRPSRSLVFLNGDDVSIFVFHWSGGVAVLSGESSCYPLLFHTIFSSFAVLLQLLLLL